MIGLTKYLIRLVLIGILGFQAYTLYNQGEVAVVYYIFSVSSIAFLFGYMEGKNWEIVDKIFEKIEDTTEDYEFQEEKKPWE